MFPRALGPAGSGSLRLVGGGSRCAGRVEIFQHGTWGRVLSEQWDVAEARVACRQLRCGEAEMAYNPPKAERGTGPVGLRGGGWAAGPRRHLCSVPAAGSRHVRLANGPGRCAGRVEIYSQGSWGSVCDDGWDLPDAAVVCRQLGCGEAVEAPGSAAFGEGSGHIWLDGVNCSGAEAALWDCPAGPWGRHDCGHKEDAGAVCSEFTALRLENSDGCSGRLQVFYNGTWGSVCSNSMTPKTVSLACEELGCGKEGTLDTQGPRGRVSGPAWLDRVECEERHGSFWLCPSDPWNPRSCDELRDVTHITCRGAAELRLVDGGSRCAGRVEVEHEGQWGTVCSVNWDLKDAAVVCKQLGCGSAVQAFRHGNFGPGSGPIWLIDIQCRGSEPALSNCTHSGWGENNCVHSMDAGVSCSGFVRLVGGDNDCSGHVEIHDGEKWKSVRASAFGARAAAVVCRELQCGAALNIQGAARDGASTGFRLVNGSTACEGRVELHVQGTWGSLCASRWHLSDAHVLCGRLGCGFAVSLPRGGSFGRGTGPVWRDSFRCSGTEAHLGQCPVTVLGASPCSHEDAAAVVCSGPAGSGSLRLVGGGSRCAGRVEIFQRGTWGRVLSEQWDVAEARVACRQLRCGEAETAYKPPKAERGPGPVGLRGVRCQGHEAQLSLCNVSWPAAGVMEDVGVVCQGSRLVRLANGPGRCAGRVEIYSQGSWGSVCDDSWDLPNAAVVCRQLGCGEAVEAPGSAAFGEGSGHIWLDGVNCSGAEAALWDCPAGPWGRHDCGHKEDAGAVCSEFTALRLENSDGCSGRLQVFYNGTWGSVCSNSMTPKTVSLACEELGCGKEGTLDTQGPRGRLSGPAWLDRVECEERHGSFWLCPSDPWNPRSCDELRDVTHITCRGTRPKMTPTPGSACPNATSCTDRERIRAVGGEDGCSGRVELWHRGSWGTVCNDAWDVQDAEVACRQLGCGPAMAALPEAAFGEGTGPIWLEQVECQGTEAALQHCWAWPGDRGLCRHKEDAAVRCAAASGTAAPTPRADPTRGRPTSSRSVSLPVIMCMILGALVSLLLALLAWRVLSARTERRGSQTALEPFPEAVYQEIGYSPVWEEQARFSPSGSYLEGSLTKLQLHHMDSEEEDGLGSARGSGGQEGVDVSSLQTRDGQWCP
ncbi:scavenger receptor cysteine-rich type 1 protein M130-like [Colius striatus]|uniref:scavenger receptor cysteine-rich type 1 protein M130-like n=1 Tax=Colius striatus TaxID=57412 RepID=UPI002B1E4036|nr:scavenger receptor cysteine-rich type 1 protein M130-like [Colius striatus]